MENTSNDRQTNSVGKVIYINKGAVSAGAERNELRFSAVCFQARCRIATAEPRLCSNVCRYFFHENNARYL